MTKFKILAVVIFTVAALAAALYVREQGPYCFIRFCDQTHCVTQTYTQAALEMGEVPIPTGMIPDGGARCEERSSK